MQNSKRQAGTEVETSTNAELNLSAPITPSPMLAAVEFREPLCLCVKYELSAEFVSKVNSESNCKVQKVIEILNCKMLEYWIDCPKEKESLITDYAFMTWIKNPVFQKYYLGTKAFEQIAENYISERNKIETDNLIDFEKQINKLSSTIKSLRTALFMALFHDGWAEENGSPKPVGNCLGSPNWVVKSFEALAQ